MPVPASPPPVPSPPMLVGGAFFHLYKRHRANPTDTLSVVNRAALAIDRLYRVHDDLDELVLQSTTTDSRITIDGTLYVLPPLDTHRPITITGKSIASDEEKYWERRSSQIR